MNNLLSAKLLLPYSLCAYIAAEAARGLMYMHELKAADGSSLHLVHRDVSPENILVSREGEVKISDFGLVKYNGAPVLTNVGKVRGKLPYMAPERVIGHEATRASDQFSLGMVLHEMLTGKRYFSTAMGRKQVQQELIHQPIAPPKLINPTVPDALNAIVMRATQMEPMERYASMADMEDELRRYVHADPTMANPELTLSNLVRSIYVGRSLEGRTQMAVTIRELLGDTCRSTRRIDRSRESTKVSGQIKPLVKSRSPLISGALRLIQSIFPTFRRELC